MKARTFIHRYSFTFVIVKYYILFVILYRLATHSDVGCLNLLHSLWWYMGHKSVRRQPSADSSATSAGHTRWSGVRCRRSIDVELTAETFTRPFLQHFCFWPSSRNTPFLRVRGACQKGWTTVLQLIPLAHVISGPHGVGATTIAARLRDSAAVYPYWHSRISFLETSNYKNIVERPEIDHGLPKPLLMGWG